MILPEVYQPRPASVFILVSTALYGPAALNHMVDSMPGSLVDTVPTGTHSACPLWELWPRATCSFNPATSLRHWM